MIFSEKLKLAMKTKGFTQSALAQVSGVKQSAISAYCARTSTPSVDALFRLAKALDLTMEALYAEDEINQEKSVSKSIKTEDLEKKIRDLKKVCEVLGKQVLSLGQTVDEFSQIISK